VPVSCGVDEEHARRPFRPVLIFGLSGVLLQVGCLLRLGLENYSSGIRVAESAIHTGRISRPKTIEDRMCRLMGDDVVRQTAVPRAVRERHITEDQRLLWWRVRCIGFDLAVRHEVQLMRLKVPRDPPAKGTLEGCEPSGTDLRVLDPDRDRSGFGSSRIESVS
jgi:hypothetical protein